LTMQQLAGLDDRPKGYINATVQPSNRIEVPARRGIYVGVNDSYELKEPDKATGSDEIIRLLEINFDNSLQRSDWIIDQVMRIDHEQ
jgi:hypothetical protein